MANKKKLKVQSLTKKAETPPVEKPIVADNTVSPEVTATPETPAPAVEKSPKIISPLLSEAVEIKEHAMGIGPNQQQGSAPATNSFEVDNDFWGTKPYIDPKTVQTPVTPVAPATPVMPALPVDVPEQKFSSQPAGGTETNPIVDAAALQAASDMVDTIMEMYKRGVPEITHDKTKIKSKDIKEIKSLENKGEVLVGVSEEFIIVNKENKKRFEDRAASDAILLKKPLKKWLGTKNIPIPPYVEFIIVLIFIGITYFFLIKEIKTSNDALLEGIYEKVRKKKEAEIQTVEAEEVPRV